MASEPLVDVAGRIADGQEVDWAAITSTPLSDEDRDVAEKLAVVARIAAEHRNLHQLLPVVASTLEPWPDRSRWGHLDVLGVLGQGSYGTVYRAWDTRLERMVALKLFHRAPDANTVMQEGRMLARVRDEHVVTVYGADIVSGVAGIWMELVHGHTLDRLVRDKGPMSTREAAAIGADVARALTAVHDAGLLHCDVKAQNVVREAGGRVVLMDLGAGRTERDPSDSDRLSDVAGTPRYMAPELFQRGATATQASDIYSLGVLLYYLATGRFPVDGKSFGELKQAHREGRVTPLASVRPDLPPAFVALVTSALDAVPENRPSSAAAMRDALARLATPAVVASRPVFRWTLAGVGVAVLAIVTLRPLLVSSPPRPPAAPEVRSIAVLPIRNLTGDPSRQYVADGLTEVLISNLARVRSLRVPSSAAVAPFREGASPPTELARKLGVQLLLAGAVTQADTTMRMAVQLIDAASGTALWGEEIARAPAGMLQAQADIARMIASRLALKLTEEENRALSARPVDRRAQDAYLRGRAIVERGPASAADAERLYREAVEIAPDFAAAWARLALTELQLIDQATGIDRKRRADIARGFAERAIGLDPGLGDAYVALGSVQFYEDWDFSTAERSLRRAMEVEPSNAFARQRLSMLLAALRRFDEAVAIGRESVLVEPLVVRRATTLGGVYYYARMFDEALAEAERALTISPGDAIALHLRGRVYSAMGRHDEAIADLRASFVASPISAYLVEVARACAAAGRQDESRAALAEVQERERRGQGYSPDDLAYVAAAEGRPDEAFRILEQAVDRRVQSVLWLAVDPRADNLHGDSRFDRLLARIGLNH
jgi:serine/threonine-protein kinase